MCFISCLFSSLIAGFPGGFGIGSPWVNSNLTVKDDFSAGAETLKTVLLMFSKLECKEMPYQSLSFDYFGKCQGVHPMVD